MFQEHVLGNDTDGVNPEEYNVTRMIKHENYNSRTFENDIAIVEFDTEVTFKKGIQPACLPSITPALLNDSFVSEGVIIAGWGATSFRGPTSNILLQGLISVVTNQECKEKFSQFNNGKKVFMILAFRVPYAVKENLRGMTERKKE